MTALHAEWFELRPRPVILAKAGTGRRCARALRVNGCPELGPRSSTGRLPERAVGFTLIELLVVTVIIGIGLALALANLQPDDSQAARRDAHALAGQLERIQERALFGGQAIGVTFGADGPQTWQRDPKGEWVAVTFDANIRKADIAVEALKLGAKVMETDARMVFLPDGMSLPFELTVSRNGHRFLITGDPLGRISVSAVQS
ncbi:MAG: GspH/FimT family pseudopilin [Betaproteobacteria bacterium]|nr:GspH/FimT family pseudopilin [Betaproteobacteria bacterium]